MHTSHSVPALPAPAHGTLGHSINATLTDATCLKRHQVIVSGTPAAPALRRYVQIPPDGGRVVVDTYQPNFVVVGGVS